MVDRGPLAQQELHRGDLSLEAAPAQAGESLGVGGLGVSASLKQELHQANVTLGGGHHQGGATSGVCMGEEEIETQ